LAIVRNTLFFSADDGSHGLELWQSDGSAAGTHLATDIRPGLEGSGPMHLTDVDGRLFFSADDGLNGRGVWVLDALPGDFNDDGAVNVQDVDELFAAIRTGGTDIRFNLNNDPIVDGADVDFLVEGILGTSRGDTNLDGNVDFGDFLILANAYGSPVNSWGQGDFNGDGGVGFDDFLFLAENFGYKRALAH
jgi:ELWxxDGT repeat protein